MNNNTKKLIREAAINVAIAIGIFAVVIAFLFLINLEDSINPIAIVSGLLGVSYVLTVKNPANYIGFILGVLSSIVLGIQFYMGNMSDWMILYFFVFIPCQIFTFYVWLKGGNENQKPFLPSYLSIKNTIMVAAIVVALVVVDLFVANLLKGNGFNINYLCNGSGKEITISLMGAIGVASSILANLLLIRKKTDAWIYWVIFSIATIILQLLLEDYVSVTLFVVYAIINANALIAWIKVTPKRHVSL